MADVKAIFYLPQTDNDGSDLKPLIEDVRSELFLAFGGWTFLGYVEGAYRMSDGAKSMDVSESYMVVLGEERLDELRQILTHFKNQTAQEAIYLEINRAVDIELI